MPPSLHVGMYLGSTKDTINNDDTISLPIPYTHHSHLTLTARINAHPSPVQHLPPPPYHICNVTPLSRDNGLLRASVLFAPSTCRLACVSNREFHH
jgi:hypothetical protein